MKSVNLHFSIFIKTICLDECTGISYIDSTPIRVCKNKRIKPNKVFARIDQLEKFTMGYFLDLNCLVINQKEDLLNFAINSGNVGDGESLKKTNDSLKNKKQII